MILRTPCVVMDCVTVATTFLRKLGGEVDAAKGLSDARLDERVTRTASTLGPLVKAVLRSAADVGVPLMMVRPGAEGMEEGLRARAVTVWSVGERVSEVNGGWVRGEFLGVGGVGGRECLASKGVN